MKTLTEVPALNLKNALKTKTELTTSGKTAEELPTAMGEALKLEGDKLNFMMLALETVGNKTDDLKRVIVYSLAEGEKAPQGAIQKGDHYYLTEYYPSLNKGGARQARGRGGDHDEKGRGKGRDGKGKRGGKRGERGERNDRGGERAARAPRPPRPEMSVVVVAPASGEAAPTRPAKRERRPKYEHPTTRSGLELPKPKSLSAETVATPAETGSQENSTTSPENS